MLTTQICKRKQVAEAFPVSIIQIYDLHDAKQHEFDVSVQPETQVAHSETSWLLPNQFRELQIYQSYHKR
jgi:hypothetical protein